MTIGAQISDMTPIAFDDMPDDAALPWVTTTGTGGYSLLRNYRSPVAEAIRARVSYTALAAADGATLVGSTGPSNVQADLDARPTSADLSASAGSALVGYLPSGTGAVARTAQDKMRDTVSIFDFIPVAQQAAIQAGTTVYDCTADITAAVAYIDGSGQTLHFPGGTYLVSIATFSGSNYSVDTSSGVLFKQKTGVVADVLGAPACVRIVNATNLSFGDLNTIGNITLDSGEDNHGVGIGKSKNIRVGRIFATNVRGDALYCYARNTSDPERLGGVDVESVSGTNVFRNLLTVTGGQVRVGSVINAGPVGYRDFDVEPNNASGTYEAVDLEIGYVKAGSCEITSDDLLIINHAVRIGILDCDFNRVQVTTPPYPSAPGAGAYALGVSRTEMVQIGYFKARNYNLYPLSLALTWSVVDIGTFDVAFCSLTDTTYNTMILQQGNAQGGAVRIGTLICDATNGKYQARVVGTGILKIDAANIRTMKCMPGVQISGRFANGTIDLNSGTGIALVNCSGVTFDNVTTSGGGASGGFYQCSNISIANSTMTFGTLDNGGTGSSNVIAVNSVVNGSSAAAINMLSGGAMVKIIGLPGAAIADVATGGGATAAANATAINSILARMRAGTPTILP